MWTREDLKYKAKQALKNNYWKIVLVSLLVGVIGAGTTAGISNTFESDSESIWESEDSNSLEDFFSESGSGYTDDIYDMYENEYEYEYDYEYDYGSSSGDMGGLSTSQIVGVFAIFGIIILVVMGIAIVVAAVYSAFIYNPLGVGTNRFFLKSLNEKAEAKEIVFAFDHNYKNVIKILFIRDVKVFLWGLLFIIPGIIKSYEYYMMPYLLAENPNLTKEEAFRLSKQMMTGNKFETFILEISFFWWDLLSAMTAGIVGIFYVQPYKNLTFAALYEELSAINGYPAKAVQVQSENSYVQSDYYYTAETQNENTEDNNAPEE